MGSRWLPADMAVSSKFAAFNIRDIVYKVDKNVRVPASILLPKTAKPGMHPVLVRWHGGCFITGHRMYPDWFAGWTLELAVSRDAIIISPDYRLMPEVNGMDIFHDINALFRWLLRPRSLESCLPDGIIPDLDHILVTGESAGGWLAIQSALCHYSKRNISAVILHYPMIDMKDPHYTGDFEKDLFTPAVPQMDPYILQEYVTDMRREDVVTSAVPPDRVPLVVSFLQQGAYRGFFGDRKDLPDLYPLEVLDHCMKELPAVWLIHGTGDTVVPVEGSYKLEEKLRKYLTDSELLVHYDEGSDHGFDNASSVNLGTDWVKKGLDFLAPHWPQC